MTSSQDVTCELENSYGPLWTQLIIRTAERTFSLFSAWHPPKLHFPYLSITFHFNPSGNLDYQYPSRMLTQQEALKWHRASVQAEVFGSWSVVVAVVFVLFLGRILVLLLSCSHSCWFIRNYSIVTNSDPLFDIGNRVVSMYLV